MNVTLRNLWLSVPIAGAATATSLAGVLGDPYAAETTNWAAQAAGQDVVNLAIYPTMVFLAWRAARGSVRAYLAWLGLLAYTAYSFFIYAGYLHFSAWFLVYVAIFGMSCFALAVGTTRLDPARVRALFGPATPTRSTSWILGGVGTVFGALWLSEILPPTLAGTVPQPIVDAGLVTNPVWVLDLGIVIPAMIVVAVLLRRGRAAGYLLAAPLLSFGVAMCAAIVGLLLMLGARGEPIAVPAIAMVATTVVLQAVALVRFGRGLRAGAELSLTDGLRIAEAHPFDGASATAGAVDLPVRQP